MNVTPDTLAIYCVDCGKLGTGFAWARQLGPATMSSSSPTQLVDGIVVDLKEERRVALGFEAPLFIPLPTDAEGWTRSRVGEGRYAWSVAAGREAFIASIPQVVWVLHQVRQRLGDDAPSRASFEWDAFITGRSLFLWEAFITGPVENTRPGGEDRRPEDDMADAVEGARLFSGSITWDGALPRLAPSHLPDGGAVYNIAAAAALRAGWIDDVAALGRACHVVRGTKPARRP
jgi:hypothetical protein